MRIEAIMTSNPITVEVTVSLSEAISTMDELEIRHLPVVRDGRFVGVVSDRDLHQFTGWMWNEERGKAPASVEDVFQSDVMTLSPEDTVATLATKLVEWGVGCAPVVEDGQLRGIATDSDVLRVYVKARESGDAGGAKEPRVEERMTADVVTLISASTAKEAWDLMREGNVHHMPVVDGLKVVGIVSDRDVRVVLGRALPGHTPVREFMHTRVLSVAPEDGLSSAAHLMEELKIGSLPVVERDDLVGIITLTDLLEHCARVL